MAQVESSKTKGRAVTSLKRSSALPDVPTSTPRALVTQVNRDVHTVVGDAATREQLIARGFDIALSTPEEFARYIRSEIERWGKVVRDAGIVVKS